MSGSVSLAVVPDASWCVTRDGAVVAQVAVRQADDDIVVCATTAAETERPYRFESMQAANEFVADLMTSFSYLGCDVAPG